jgi:outer membrane biosynthesis protein TonB
VKTTEVATLPKGLLVFRLVSVDNFQLVEFPSGIGQFSQGWVETKGLSDVAEKVSRDAALSEKKTASVKVVDGGAPKPTPSGSAAPKPTPSASAAPKPSASVAPKPTPSASAAPKPKASSTKPVPPPPPKPKKDDK